jgi:ATP synthase protein I
MMATYARIARRSAASAAGVAVIMAVVGALVGGGKGLLGAAIGVAVVAMFFAVSIVAVGRAARVSPQVMMVTAMISYLVKIAVLIVLAGSFQNSTAFSARMFGLTAIVCVLAYCAGQVVWTMRLKMLYVKPDGER